MFLHMRNFGLSMMIIILALEIGRAHFLTKIANIFIEILMNRRANFWKKFFRLILHTNDFLKFQKFRRKS